MYIHIQEMSIANLLVPNEFNLQCNSITIAQQSSLGPYRVDWNILDQNMASGADTLVQFNVPIASKNFPAPAGGTTYTIPFAGLYAISYSVNVTKTNGIGQIVVWINPSGPGPSYGTSSSPSFEVRSMTVGPPVSNITFEDLDTVHLTGSAMIPLSVGQTIDIRARQISGINQTIHPVSISGSTVISIVFVSPF